MKRRRLIQVLTAATAVAALVGAATVSTAWATSGAKSLHLTRASRCSTPGAEGTPVAVAAGTTYTAFVTTNAIRGEATISVRFRDPAGRILADARGPGGPGNIRSASGTAPAGTATASVLISTDGEVYADDVLVSAMLTDLGAQINVPGSANGTAYGKDTAGRDIAYTVVAGAHGVDAWRV